MKTSTLLYVGHFFSSWGDRMWAFAIPLFLLDLDATTLTLAAVYGLVVSATVLVFGPVAGDWVDRTPRLRAIRIALVTQNTFVILCAALLLTNRLFPAEMAAYQLAVKVGAILLGAVSYLATSTCGIIIQKDWIVVIAGGDDAFMAGLNSMVRRIDLFTKIVSPLVCGQIMGSFELTGGALFIVAWNFSSMFLEYFLLSSVYRRTPALALKQNGAAAAEDEGRELQVLNADADDGSDEAAVTPTKKPTKEDNRSFLQVVFAPFITLKNGWQLYFAQPIALPCFGFSLLYLTVLGFGYITTAYAYNQCFSELMVGVMLACAAVAGIFATYAFPWLRRRVGLIRTGLFSAAIQTSTLFLCVASVFIDGSPFFLLEANSGTPTAPTGNWTAAKNSSAEPESSLYKCLDDVEPPSSHLSLFVLMAGIIVARIGLWGFDLTITQLIQETIVEKERGVFNGVQNSLNNLMDLLNFVLVIIFPRPDHFAVLIFVSSAAVSLCYLLFCVYAYRVRGHLLPHFRRRKSGAVFSVDIVEKEEESVLKA